MKDEFVSPFMFLFLMTYMVCARLNLLLYLRRGLNFITISRETDGAYFRCYEEYFRYSKKKMCWDHKLHCSFHLWFLQLANIADKFNCSLWGGLRPLKINGKIGLFQLFIFKKSFVQNNTSIYEFPILWLISGWICNKWSNHFSHFQKWI